MTKFNTKARSSDFTQTQTISTEERMLLFKGGKGLGVLERTPIRLHHQGKYLDSLPALTCSGKAVSSSRRERANVQLEDWKQPCNAGHRSLNGIGRAKSTRLSPRGTANSLQPKLVKNQLGL